MQPDTQYRPDSPRGRGVEHLQALAAAQIVAVDIVHHIGVEADEIGHRRHGVAHQRQARSGGRADQRQCHAEEIHQAADRIHPAARHMAVGPRHHQPPAQRDDPSQEVDLGGILGRAHGITHHQRHDRDQRAAHGGLQPGQQGEMLYFRHARQAKGEIVDRHGACCGGMVRRGLATDDIAARFATLSRVGALPAT